MPMNDATTVTAVYMSSSNTVGVSKAELYTSSGNGVSSPGLSPGHPFYNLQGQKWQQVFDFEKVLKQLRTAEKTYLRGKGSGSSEKNILSGGGSAPRQVVIQVQRLNAQDMHFFDIAPKQTARDVVICNTCMGYYTKMGFNNHVMLNHPTIWAAIPNKLNATHASDFQIYSTALHATMAVEHSLDGIKEVSTEVIGSPTDMSGTVSTCSSSSSSLSSPYPVPAAVAVSATSMPVISTSSSTRHKSSSSKSSSSKSGGGSGSSSRSRSKSKHHHTTSSSSTYATSTTEASIHGSHKNSSSSSKKSSHSSSYNNSIGSAQGHIMSHSHSVKDAYDTTGTGMHITLYSSSSSNSSCSLPATPKIVGSTAHHDVLSNTIHETGYSPAHNANVPVAYNDIKDKPIAEHANMVPSKKKSKSPAILAQESIDSTTSSSTSSSEFERKLRLHHTKAPTKPISANQMPPYELQISELDQAVSSITGGGPGGTAGANESMNTLGYTQQQNVLPTNIVEEQIPHNTSEDNSISLTLDDMLDTKFINEILNTAESEIPFDESVLDPALQQSAGANNQTTTYMQQPASKRMRYDDGNGSEMVATNYAAVYQQQHPQQHQQTQYDGNNMQDIKLYNQSVDDQQQMQDPQLTSIDAMQLQQLIYQQQQMLEAEQKQISVDAGYAALSASYETQQPMTPNVAAASNQQQQFNVYNVPSLTDDNVEAYENIIMPSIIYEITANNQVTVMDQQSQQQVIAEFLTQAGYDNVEQMNVLTASAAPAGPTEAADSNAALDTNCGSWADFNELCDIDYSKLETATTITSTSASSSSSSNATSEAKTVKLVVNNPQQKTEEPNYPPHRRMTHTKFHEDFYFNVFLYNGVPRPLTMNTFGLIKLPQCAAITFRKHLLTTRKANNSLLSLSSVGHNMGGINGVIGGASARYPLHAGGNSKQNFYTSTGIAAAASGVGVGNANEFSIGSITITNAGSNNSNSINNQQTGSGINKHKSISGTLGATTSRLPPTNGATHVKTIYANKSNTISNERIKCVKRALVSKLDYNRNGIFTAKKLNDLLNGKVKEKEPDRSEQQDIKSEISESQQLQEQNKLKRMQCFYEKRRRLLHMSTGNCSRNEYDHHHHHHHHNHNQHHNHKHKQQQQRLQARSPTMQFQSHGGVSKQQRQEKLLKRQLIRTLSDSCGLNQWKSASNSPSAGSNSSNISGNDLMRVFV